MGHPPELVAAARQPPASTSTSRSELTDLLGAPDTLLLPTITLIHTSVIPVLAGQGAVLVDAQAHKTIYEGCTVARGGGATLHRVRSNDPGAPRGDPPVAAADHQPGCSAWTG